jgi:hypothetical protein
VVTQAADLRLITMSPSAIDTQGDGAVVSRKRSHTDPNNSPRPVESVFIAGEMNVEGARDLAEIMHK